MNLIFFAAVNIFHHFENTYQYVQIALMIKSEPTPTHQIP